MVGPEPLVLLDIDPFRFGQERLDLGFQFGLAFDDPVVAHGLVATGRRRDLRPVDRHPVQLDQPRLATQLEHLDEQGLDRLEMAAAEPGDGAVIRGGVARQETERHIRGTPPLDLPRRRHPDRMT
jgi:hypothetical protein